MKRDAEILPTLSPKLSKPIARDPRITVKFNHDKKVLSLAKKTLGSTLVGKAILFPGAVSKLKCMLVQVLLFEMKIVLHWTYLFVIMAGKTLCVC